MAASYASNKDTKEVLPSYITLDELAKEVMPLLSHYAFRTTQEIPVFTEWVENALKGSILLPKKNFWYRPRTY